MVSLEKLMRAIYRHFHQENTYLHRIGHTISGYSWAPMTHFPGPGPSRTLLYAYIFNLSSVPFVIILVIDSSKGLRSQEPFARTDGHWEVWHLPPSSSIYKPPSRASQHTCLLGDWDQDCVFLPLVYFSGAPFFKTTVVYFQEANENQTRWSDFRCLQTWISIFLWIATSLIKGKFNL